MRISIDCRYVRGRPSGIGSYVQALVDRLPALAPDDTFHLWVSPRAPGPLSNAGNVREQVVRPRANNIPTLLWPHRLVDLSAVDVLHEPFNILGRAIPCPTVVTVHDLMRIVAPEVCGGPRATLWLRSLFYQHGVIRALEQATRIVAISNATADDIQRLFPASRPRVRVIHHGVSPLFAPPTDPEAARARSRELVGASKYFLVLGQNAPYKNHPLVLEAFRAAGLDEDVRLVFVQRLHRSLLARALKPLRAHRRVVWLGAVSEPDMVVLLQSALALVQFSQYEGFGMPALEAMACGTAVIASDIPALAEVVGSAGAQVPLDVAALAAAMKRAVSDAGWRRELSTRGPERAREFSWATSAAAHLDVYREAAAVGGA